MTHSDIVQYRPNQNHPNVRNTDGGIATCCFCLFGNSRIFAALSFPLTLMLTLVCNFGDVVATLQGIKLLIDQSKEMKTDMIVFGQNMNQSWRQVV